MAVKGRLVWLLVFVAVACGAAGPVLAVGDDASAEDTSATAAPPVIFICIDALRADHLTAYGCQRPLSPHIDALLGRGVVMTTARTPIPLTAPSLATVLSSLQPHHHGSTRNGVPIYPGLTLLPDVLAAKGYETAAVISNWTLRNRLSGLGDHFDTFLEVFNRKRWGHIFKSEGSAQVVNRTVFQWLDSRPHPEKPLFLWVHYIEPHAPYRFHPRYGEVAGVNQGKGESANGRQRYATEVAAVDERVGELLDGLKDRGIAGRALVVLFSDHGESLGEHKYWGHGQHCYEPILRVALGFVWQGVIPGGRTVPSQVTLADVAPTVFGLLGMPSPPSMIGRDLSAVCRGEAELPEQVCYYQAQRGAVVFRKNVEKERDRGLLEICRIMENEKVSVRYHSPPMLRRFDLAADPGEENDLAGGKEPIPPDLLEWRKEILEAGPRVEEAPALDDEDVEQLRALGYLE